MKSIHQIRNLSVHTFLSPAIGLSLIALPSLAAEARTLDIMAQIPKSFTKKASKKLQPGYKNNPQIKATVKIQNPLGFSIQELKGNVWKSIGNSRSYQKSYTVSKFASGSPKPNIKKFRIVDNSNSNASKFYHSGGPLHAGIYRRRDYTVSLVEGSSTLMIRPTEVEVSSYLGQGQLFKGSNYNTPSLETALCPYLTQNMPIVSYIPYYGGTINGKRANGTRRNYLVGGTSQANFRNWCNNNFLGKSGFIRERLSFGEMIAAILDPKLVIKASTVAKMPAEGNRTVAFWSPTNKYAAFIYDSETKSFEHLKQFNTSVRTKMIELFTKPSKKKFYLVRHIKAPSTPALKTQIADFSRIINDLNNFRAELRASGGGGSW